MPTLDQLVWRFRKLRYRGPTITVALVLLATFGAVAFMLLTEIRVIDGDTVRYGFRTVRLVGFDTPESGDRARCDFERMRASLATARLRELIASGQPELKLVPCACPPGTEGTRACNFGRSCGVLTVDGRDVGPILIIEGLARPIQCIQYSCPPRRSWC